MNRPCLGLFVLTGLLGFARSIEAAPATPPVAAGVIVERVGAGSLGERAGLKPGDVLVSWQLQPSFPANPFPAAGWLASPFDLLEALIEQAPRGRLTLSGSRAGAPRAWTLTEGASVERAAIGARPPLTGEALARYEQALRHREKGEVDQSLAAWRAAAEAALASRDSAAGLWLLYRQAEVRLEGELSGWDTFPGEVAPVLMAAGRDLAAAELYAFSADLESTQGEFVRSEAIWRKALACLSHRSARSLAAARVEAGLVRSLQLQQRFDPALSHLKALLATRAALAPWSLDLAESTLSLGDNAYFSGGIGRTLQPYVDSEWLLRRLDPGSKRHVRRLLALGEALYNIGEAREGEGVLREALRHSLAVAPASSETGTLTLILAGYAANRAAWREAEVYLRDSIRIYEGLPPTLGNRWRRSKSLALLGSIRLAVGDPEGAERFGRLAVQAHSELGAVGWGDTLARDFLASTLIELGRFDEARQLLNQALAEKPQDTGNQRNRVRTLQVLSELEIRAGKSFPAATRALREAETLFEEADRRGTLFAELLRAQGEVEGNLGRPEKALALLGQALALQRAAIPGSVDEAITLRLIGRQQEALGRTAEASRSYCDATRTLDRLGDRAGRSEGVSSSYFAARSGFYSDCVESLADLGKSADAFQVLESGRARSLLEMMAHRELSTGEISAAARDERKRLIDRYETLYSSLLGPRTGSDPERDLSTRLELGRLQVELDALADRVRRESPRFASLHYPKPLGLTEARQALDPGTVLLAYSVGKSQSFLFVVKAAGAPEPGLNVHRLEVSSARLREDGQALTALLRERSGDLAQTRAKAKLLYRILVAPAEAELDGAERILIAPDGPLHGLPFAALLRPDGRYLVEAKPIHTVVSATVYAEIQKERRTKDPTEEIRLAAFGDPVYPAAEKLSGETRETEAGLTLRGVSLAPLPGTRREVEAIGALYPGSQVFVGSAATEERIKSIGRDPRSVRILHFAGHAVLDQRMPINSFLALSLPKHPAPGQENGLLQAWEIFENVRLDADLVTLSACNTALGKEMGGEGLIGLSRAFQFAGARSVLASLWAIGDGATARFMPRFYEHLRTGLTKDEALRRTQIEWIRDPKRSHPSHWAAFELIGDYK